MTDKPLASTSCGYCFGYTDGEGFHHAPDCPVLRWHKENPKVDSYFSLNVNPKDKNDEIIRLLKDINDELHRLYREVETIRLRMR